MSISRVRRSQKPRPSKFAMSLPSKVLEVVGRAVEAVDEADEVDQVAALMEVYPKKRLTR
jgi:hypothetical protein